MKAIYVSGPYRADTPYLIELNCRRARAEAELLWNLGFAVLSPHLNTYSMSGMLPDEEAFIEGDVRLLKGMDAIVMLPGWENSSGCLSEINAAWGEGLACFYRTTKWGSDPRWITTKRATSGDENFIALPLTWTSAEMETYADL